MNEDDIKKELAAFIVGVADLPLVHVWRELQTFIHKQYNNVGDVGIGLGQADIEFISQGQIFSVTIRVKGSVTH